MARRYDNVKRIDISTTDSRTRLGTTIYKEIPVRDTDLYILTQSGDRLDSIAQQFYGDSSMWWYIAKANGLSDINIEPGIKLRLPKSTTNPVELDKSSNSGRGSY